MGSGPEGEITALFEPGRIGSLELPNRVLMAPIERNLATADGRPTQRYIDYLVARAPSVGLLRAEATYVDPVGRARPRQLGAHGDHLLGDLARMVEAVHAAGGRISFEIVHAGREVMPTISGRRPVGPSPVACEPTGGYPPRELTPTEIAEIVERFARAAARVEQAGADAIEIHGASGYLVHAFLSPFTNRREDEYGGSPEKRMRFPLEVVEAVRGAVSANLPVIYRLGAEEFLPGGLTREETGPFALQLERAGVDLIDVAAGIYETMLAISPPMEQEPGSLLELAGEIKRGLDIPLATTGRLGTLEVAEEALRQELVDFVSIGRGLHADPELLAKTKAGRGGEARRCIACGECVSFLLEEQPTYCAINPVTAREADLRFQPTSRARRVMVVGGGPAGLEAARVAALRGHEVTLHERGEQLGGAVRYGAIAPGRSDFGAATRPLESEIQRLGVTVELGSTVTAGLVQTVAPDVVVLATGAWVPGPQPIPGDDQPHVCDAYTFLAGAERDPALPFGEGKSDAVVVFGASWVGCNIASILLESGARVELVEPREAIAWDFGAAPAMPMIERLESHPDLTIHLRSTVERIDSAEAVLWTGGEEPVTVAADRVVRVQKLEPNPALKDELRRLDLDTVPELFEAGDCIEPRKLQDALLEAATIANRL